MPCGMSSLLVQVTAVPAFTVKVCGPNVKLSTDTALACAALSARTGRTIAASAVAVAAPSAAATSALRIVLAIDMVPSLRLERRVDDGETLLVLLEGDIGDAEHGAQLIVRDFHRPRRGRGARRRLRERGRARGVERDVAFHLLHHLVDVAVEHRHLTEALEV